MLYNRTLLFVTKFNSVRVHLNNNIEAWKNFASPNVPNKLQQKVCWKVVQDDNVDTYNEGRM